MDRPSVLKTMLRVHDFLPASLANGPGRRAVLWVQGCTLGCPGCFNPQTHAASGGKEVPAADVFEQIFSLQAEIEGITISGGEPLQQAEPLSALLQAVRGQTSLSIVLFTGYTWDEVQRDSAKSAVLPLIDILIAGRYLQEQRCAEGLIASKNQTLHCLTSRYTPSDFSFVPSAEVIISPDGELTLSGIDPVR